MYKLYIERFSKKSASYRLTDEKVIQRNLFTQAAHKNVLVSLCFTQFGKPFKNNFMFFKLGDRPWFFFIKFYTLCSIFFGIDVLKNLASYVICIVFRSNNGFENQMSHGSMSPPPSFLCLVLVSLCFMFGLLVQWPPSQPPLFPSVRICPIIRLGGGGCGPGPTKKKFTRGIGIEIKI